jgi:PPP family 3-phenylpropionic acid transporter
VTAIRVIFLLGGIVIATFYPFASVILNDRGFDPAQIGLVMAGGSVAFALSVPVWGHLADVRLGRAGALRIAVLLSGLALVSFGLPWPAVVLAAMFLAFAGTESAIAPLSDAIAVNALPHPERQYPWIRLLTSLSFAITAIACGFLYDETGYWPSTLLYAPWLPVGGAGLAPDRPRADFHQLDERRRRGGSFRVAFAVQPRLPGVLAAIFLVHIGVIGGFTFLSLRIVELGGAPSDVALSSGLSALAEVPGMLLAGWLVSRLGLRGLFAAGTLVYAACIASWVVLMTPQLIVATRIVSGFAFSAIWVASVLTMQRLLPPRLQGTGQPHQTTAFAGGRPRQRDGRACRRAGTGPFFAIATVARRLWPSPARLALPGRRAPATWPDEEADAERRARWQRRGPPRRRRPRRGNVSSAMDDAMPDPTIPSPETP